MKSQVLTRWTAKDSAELYGIESWGKPFFGVSAEGEATVALRHGAASREISLMEIARGLEERGVSFPVMLRFGDILDSLIGTLNETFQAAIRVAGYRGAYRGVYPIKVNQQQQVVEEIARFGRRYHHGFEAGSKAELIAALAYLHDPEAFIVCNGYKDAGFIDLALYARQMGLNAILVVEMPGEIDLILERSAALGVDPVMGVRVRLSTPGSGMWLESGGDSSVFGLNAGQIIDMVDRLKTAGKLQCLRMLHYHLGSQIPNIRTVRASAAEAARVYVDLVREGAPMGLIDIGGGLAVDYDGTQTNFASSRNYTLEEYCADVVEVIAAAAEEAELPHPDIISESGRATVANYAVLLFNVLDHGRFEPESFPAALNENAHEYLHHLAEINGVLSPKNLQECYNDALFYRDEIRSLFQHGGVSLRERAVGEEMFACIMARIAAMCEDAPRITEELERLQRSLADVYYGNFSLFQSLPDAWAIDQLFPVMPIHRLGERPVRQGIFSDLTCDCDGKIDRFIDIQGVRRSLPLHLPNGGNYLIGVFLVGAYQETLGDLHNLFGDTNVVSVRLDENGALEYSHEVQGDTVADVLSYVEYEPKAMLEQFRQLTESAVRSGKISPVERRKIMEAYEAGMRGYTYYEA